MIQDLNVLILAAGKGSRIKSKIPKVLLKINGKSLLEHSIKLAYKIKPKNIFILINKKLNFLKKKFKKCKFIYQDKPLGTGNAVKIFLKKKPEENKLLVLLADTPFIKLKDIKIILKKLNFSDLVLYGFKSKNNKSYGLIKLNKKREAINIIEYKNANSKDKKINICNSGIMGIRKSNFKNIRKIKKNKLTKEYYLTDIVYLSKNDKMKIDLLISNNQKFSRGINTLEDYKKMKKISLK